MSLDQKLAKLAVDGLETVALACETISTDRSWPADDRVHARNYLEDYRAALVTERTTKFLRDGFKYFGNIVADKARTSADDMYGFLAGTSGVGSLVGVAFWNLPTALLGLGGSLLSLGMRWLMNYNLKKQLRRDTGAIYGADEEVWSEALSRIHYKVHSPECRHD